ncbi:MAG: 3-deoxy-8-phosphooctulonate synthase, partial [Nitrospirota bacterium]|nr:3-deoxy-8-phosphooctulonate synthase [Nitrospirota bacterium]
MVREVDLGGILSGGGHAPVLIAGPCVIENEQVIMETALRVAEIAKEAGFPYIFKSSYDKANRSSIHSFRGPGLEKGLALLQKVKDQVGIPVLTDVHSVEEAERAGKV